MREALPDADRELVARCQAGDRLAFDELYRRHYVAAVRFAYPILQDVHEAEDVAQEAMIKALDGLCRFRGQSAFRTWLYRIATRQAIDRQRQAVPMPPWAPDAADGPGPDEIARHELRLDLRGAMAMLSADHRQAVWLRYVMDLPEARIADVMGCRPGTVKSRLHRARRMLRNALAEPPDLQSDAG